MVDPWHGTEDSETERAGGPEMIDRNAEEYRSNTNSGAGRPTIEEGERTGKERGPSHTFSAAVFCVRSDHFQMVSGEERTAEGGLREDPVLSSICRMSEPLSFDSHCLFCLHICRIRSE